MNTRHAHRGFTLIEVLITIVVVGLIAVALVNLFRGYFAVVAIQQARINVNGSARLVANTFKHSALQARSLVSSHTFSGVTHTSGSTTAVFQLPSINASGTVISGLYDYVAVYATSSDAYEVTDGGAGSARVSHVKHLSDVISSLSFTYNNAVPSLATSTSIDVQTQATARGQTTRAHVQETIRLRNL